MKYLLKFTLAILLLIIPQALVAQTIGNQPVVGNVAAATADAGNPVKVGGRFNTTPPTLTDGQRGDMQLSSAGNVLVHIKASDVASGGTSSSFGSAFPSSGTAAGFSDGTNMRPGYSLDADTGGGTQYMQGINLRRTASGGSAELLGQNTMALSLPVSIASDQTSLAVVGALSDNAANPTNKLGVLFARANAANPAWTEGNIAPASVDLAGYQRVVQKNFSCGSTAAIVDWAAITTTPTAPSGFNATACMSALGFTNITSTQATVTVTDGQGSPVTILNALPIPGNTTVIVPFYGMRANTGIQWSASANSTITAGATGWK